MKILVIYCSILLCLASCGNQQEEYRYSSEKVVATRLFTLSLDEIKSVACRINLESKDSFFSPPVLDEVYKIVGIVYLTDDYKVLNIKELQQKEVSVLYPASLSTQDWSASLEWDKQLMQDAVHGEIYYSQSLHAIYFELIYQP